MRFGITDKQARREYLETHIKWRRWFAWYPVTITRYTTVKGRHIWNETTVWWELIEVRGEWPFRECRLIVEGK